LELWKDRLEEVAVVDYGITIAKKDASLETEYSCAYIDKSNGSYTIFQGPNERIIENLWT